MNLLSLKIGNQTINAPTNLPQPSTDMVGKILSNGINIFLITGIIVSVLVIVWGGISWITSGGDKQKLASARARITWAIIGLIIMFVSFFIINILSYFLKINLLNITI